MRRCGLLFLILILGASVRVAADDDHAVRYHEGHEGHEDHERHEGHEEVEGHEAQEHAEHQVNAGQEARDAVTPMPYEASGTAWEPASTSLPGLSTMRGAWTLMAHWNVFAGFLFESGEPHRRSHQFTSINWGMGMASREAWSGRLQLRGMLSAEPWTVRGCGYPDLLATGENCDRDNIHDHQHPHDLVMELAASYDRGIGRGLRWQIYGGPVAEPALGPAAFPHRAAAYANPIAPIGHHWLDATHISYGVVTTGVFSRRWKIEASVFNGREPDEERTDFDFGAMDSYSGRIAFAPAASLTLQVSAGHLHEAESGVGSLPRTTVDRATASLSYVHTSAAGTLATTVAYGANAQDTRIPTGIVAQTSHAVLAEASLAPDGRSVWFGRAEAGGKPGHDLHATEYEDRVLTVGKLEAGYTRFFTTWRALQMGAGGTLSTGILPSQLVPYYGGRFVPGFALFANIRPAASHHHH